MDLFWQITIVEFLLNVAVFAAAVLLYAPVRAAARRINRESTQAEHAAEGILFGAATALAFLMPIHLDGGASIGGQTILLALAGPLGGMTAAIIAAVIAVSAGSLLVADSAHTAIVSSLISIACGLAFRVALEQRKLSHRAFGYGHLPLLGALSGTGTLIDLWLFDGSAAVIASILPVMASSILAAMILGTLLLHEKQRYFSERKLRESEAHLASSLSLLTATLDSTADGVLALQLSNDAISYNHQFTTMWAIPPAVQERRNRDEILASAASQVLDSKEFLRRTEFLFANPEDDRFDVLELKDGRAIERYVKPQRIEGKTVGVVLNFRDITERKRIQAEIQSVHEQLVEASRQAGKAEIATNVLHNVGNVLNSVNVSATLVADNIKKSRISGLAKAVEMLREHEHDLGDYLSRDPRGTLLPTYLAQLSEHLLADQKTSLKELKCLGENIEHIKEIVATQQTHARAPSMLEVVNVGQLVEEALRGIMTSAIHHKVQVVCDIDDIPQARLDKYKVLQILVNMVSNAKNACNESERTDKCMTVRVRSRDSRVSVAVIDNGVGIPADNLTKIFGHGFTTRTNGHGYGLHSAALTAKQLGGVLRAQSDGVGQGATFTLELPLNPLESPS